MAKKVKDYYDLVYAEDLGRRLQTVTDKFDAQHFMSLVESDLEALEFTQRQELLAKSIKECLPLSYADSLKIFEQILGPELEGGLGMFSEGYWLWPIGKYVELYGGQEFDLSAAFSKELTKRFTGEFSMRPLLANYPKATMDLLVEWSKDENMRVRRLASECMRIRLPWAKKQTVVLDYFDEFTAILKNLKDDADKSIQKSVANNLNDLYKEAPEKFERVIGSWQEEELSPSCAWIIKHASRTKNKAEKQALLIWQSLFLVIFVWCKHHRNNNRFALGAFVEERTQGVDDSAADRLNAGIFILEGNANGIEEDALALANEVT